MPSLDEKSEGTSFETHLATKLEDLRTFILHHHLSLVEQAGADEFKFQRPTKSLNSSITASVSSSSVASTPCSTLMSEQKLKYSMTSKLTKVKAAGRSLSAASFVKECFSASSTSYRMRSEWAKMRGSNIRGIEHTQMGTLSITSDVIIVNPQASIALQTEDSTLVESSWCRLCMLQPNNPIRVVWSLLSLVFLMCDFVLLPIDVCFDVGTNGFTDGLKLAARSFWTLDIPMSFMTGIYVEGILKMDPAVVARTYARTWLLFDICLVGWEWVIAIVKTLADGAVMSLVRGARSARVMRMLRLVRLARVIKLRKSLKNFLEFTAEGLNVSLTLTIAIILMVVFMHFGACFWGLIGAADGGWIAESHVRDAPVEHVYGIALRWMLLGVQGSRSSLMNVKRTGEIYVDTAILFSSLIFTCCIMASVTQVGIAWSQSDTVILHRMAKRYLKAHIISKRTRQRTHRFLHCHYYDGPGELLRYEGALFKALPAYLREDLHYESRAPILCKIEGFLNLHTLAARCVRRLCDIMYDKVAIEGEYVFVRGYTASEMYFVRGGTFTYKCEEEILRNTPRYDMFPRDRDSSEACDILRKGHPISEASIWTDWEHAGHLMAADEDGLLMTAEAAKVALICRELRGVHVYCYRYAYHFVGRVNRCVKCDITGFDLKMDDFTSEVHTGTSEDHFIFLSHYKIEAGTEATLLRDLLLKSISDDVTHEACDLISPVFVDSEDLEDLEELVQHVKCSSSVLVLLTPGVLSRPWCLVEMVTAVREGIHIIPIDIQRPGMKYEYPDDAWYCSLRNGKVISEEGIEMLSAMGIGLEELEGAIRIVCQQIAMPFSPHKSGTVRSAEIADILRRCSNRSLRKADSAVSLPDFPLQEPISPKHYESEEVLSVRTPSNRQSKSTIVFAPVFEYQIESSKE